MHGQKNINLNVGLMTCSKPMRGGVKIKGRNMSYSVMIYCITFEQAFA